MARAKLVSRRNYNDRKAQFRAAEAPAAVQNPPPRIGNKNIFNRRVRNRQFKNIIHGRVKKRQFKIKKLIPQF